MTTASSSRCSASRRTNSSLGRRSMQFWGIDTNTELDKRYENDVAGRRCAASGAASESAVELSTCLAASRLLALNTCREWVRKMKEGVASGAPAGSPPAATRHGMAFGRPQHRLLDYLLTDGLSCARLCLTWQLQPSCAPVPTDHVARSACCRLGSSEFANSAERAKRRGAGRSRVGWAPRDAHSVCVFGRVTGVERHHGVGHSGSSDLDMRRSHPRCTAQASA